jgi:hypothetical protein
MEKELRRREMFKAVTPLRDARLVGQEVGYGTLGQGGDLGYEGKRVSVQGQPCVDALSAHGPARLQFELEGGWLSFTCRVALNDDAAGSGACAHFLVLADGREVACAPSVRAGEPPVPLCANIERVRTIELVVLTDRWEHCHTVWLEPALRHEKAPAVRAELTDPLRRVRLVAPPVKLHAERCIATTVSPGFESYLRDLLLSLRSQASVGAGVLLVVFAVDANDACRAVAAEIGAEVVECQSITRVSIAVKAALYSVARIVDAASYLCLDADMLALGSLEPLFAACASAPPGRLLVCKEANHPGWQRLGWALRHIYFGHESDLSRFAGKVNGELDYPFVVNDGVFAGGKQALLSLDGELRRLPNAVAWMEEKPRVCSWRNQFLFNLALARLGSGWELDGAWNVQLHTHDVEFVPSDVPAREVRFRGRPVGLLHFCGVGKQKYADWRTRWRHSVSGA